jgi:NAD+ dependent glucose-6-phosphate dehydrogenase
VSDQRPVVLLTGAAGTVGTGFRDEYQQRYSDAYRLRLADRHPTFRDDRFDEPITFDIQDFDAVRAALVGVHTVIHLAANPDPTASFDELLGPNVIGSHNVFRASRDAGCQRVVFASSVHAILGYPADHEVRHGEPAWPDCLYGATKVFGEGLCAAFAHGSDLSCIAVRIGAYVRQRDFESTRGGDREAKMMAVSQRDVGQLLHKCVMASPRLKYAVLHGVSNNRYKRMEIDETRRSVGYSPVDDAFATRGAASST